tara:strand:+ start:584 stop:1027 length:444 start_codon:yes stop_codon:yes gene_type:complete
MHKTRQVVRSQADEGKMRIQYDEKENNSANTSTSSAGSGTEDSPGFAARLFSPVLNFFNGDDNENGDGDVAQDLSYASHEASSPASAKTTPVTANISNTNTNTNNNNTTASPQSTKSEDFGNTSTSNNNSMDCEEEQEVSERSERAL